MRYPVNLILAITLCLSQLRPSVLDKVTETSQIRDLGGCNIKNILFHMERLKLVRGGHGITAIQGVYEVDEDLAPLTQVGMKVERCLSYEDPRTCETYAHVKFDDPCEKFMLQKGSPWSMLFDTSPPLRCPPKKGNYTVRKAELDPKFLVGQSGVYWKAEFKLYIGKQVVACLRAGAEKTMVRKKKSKN